jgi:hypothetical protein
MKIGCLGWGSLVWNPKDLPVRGLWFSDGPLLPIEFARQSKDERITLVLCEGVSLVRSLWALMSVDGIDEAVKRLAERERIPSKNISTSLGIWSSDSKDTNELTQMIGNWAESLALDAVIWTALPPKFNGEKGKMPSADEVILHLSNLPHEKRKHAEEYIRMTPRQIDTDYRRKIEAALHWTPLSKI